MSAATRQFSIGFQSARVDRDTGVILGVAVITIGPALGHGVDIDATTLSQVKTSAETYKNGLKVKISTMKGHVGDVAEIVGSLKGFKVDGDTLRGDFHLLKSSPHREFLMEIAETIPDTFGMSISFSGPDEKREGKTFARCVEIYSCDLVAEPAANPTGLFSENQKNKLQMTPEEIKAAVDSAMSANLTPLLERLSKLEAGPVVDPAVVPDEEKPGEMSAKLKAAVELSARESALATIKQFNLSAPAPGAPSAPAPAPAPAKKFEEIVREAKTAGKKHNDVLSEAMDKHPTEYKDYETRVRRGEVVMF